MLIRRVGCTRTYCIGKSIQVTAGVCGGQPRIRNTRIPLVAFRKQGETTRNYCQTPPSHPVTYPLPGHTTNSTAKRAIGLLLPLMKMGMINPLSSA
ncbi:MAG: DUF433 domain-containing protein [Kastovskya adunca ATA6-11-RM4]|nr:DUF433 domain-containing protein [Kastovskya adunca ATA6-11-RM4]